MRACLEILRRLPRNIAMEGAGEQYALYFVLDLEGDMPACRIVFRDITCKVQDWLQKHLPALRANAKAAGYPHVDTAEFTAAHVVPSPSYLPLTDKLHGPCTCCQCWQGSKRDCNDRSMCSLVVHDALCRLLWCVDHSGDAPDVAGEVARSFALRSPPVRRTRVDAGVRAEQHFALLQRLAWILKHMTEMHWYAGLLRAHTKYFLW